MSPAAGTETAAARLADPDEQPRTTAALVASLAARLAALRLVSGADAFGSMLAGYAAVGRRVAATADGARLRAALERSSAAENGRALWEALGIDDLAARSPSPVLDHLRNDLALLVADNLDAALDPPPAPAHGAHGDGTPGEDQEEPVTVVDYLVGMWACARETVAGIEAAAAATLPPPGAVTPGPAAPPPTDGPLLR
ncbi:MAG TPA: hypothetical protein VIK95_10700 [Egibacteraceae bacterium]